MKIIELKIGEISRKLALLLSVFFFCLSCEIEGISDVNEENVEAQKELHESGWMVYPPNTNRTKLSPDSLILTKQKEFEHRLNLLEEKK